MINSLHRTMMTHKTKGEFIIKTETLRKPCVCSHTVAFDRGGLFFPRLLGRHLIFAALY